MEYPVKILAIRFETHDVKRFIVEKPEEYKFEAGQATLISIGGEMSNSEKRPFTFTSLNEEPVLEFIIKSYPAHKGVTEQLHKLKAGDELVIRDVWGVINYKGKGIFIAAGTGITPFIAIFRDLAKKGGLEGNKLIFSNKTSKDVILEKELKELLGSDLILTLTKEENLNYKGGRVDERFLRDQIEDFSQNFYVCGPKQFMADVKEILERLGAKVDSIIVEK